MAQGKGKAKGNNKTRLDFCTYSQCVPIKLSLNTGYPHYGGRLTGANIINPTHTYRHRWKN